MRADPREEMTAADHRTSSAFNVARRILKCADCSAECLTRDQLEHHVCMKHLGGWRRFDCYYCDKVNTCFRTTTQHQMLRHHARRHAHQKYRKLTTPNGQNKKRLCKVIAKSGDFIQGITQCADCDETIHHYYDLIWHVFDAHNDVLYRRSKDVFHRPTEKDWLALERLVRQREAPQSTPEHNGATAQIAGYLAVSAMRVENRGASVTLDAPLQLRIFQSVFPRIWQRSLYGCPNCGRRFFLESAAAEHVKNQCFY